MKSKLGVEYHIIAVPATARVQPKSWIVYYTPPLKERHCYITRTRRDAIAFMNRLPADQTTVRHPCAIDWMWQDMTDEPRLWHLLGSHDNRVVVVDKHGNTR